MVLAAVKPKEPAPGRPQQIVNVGHFACTHDQGQTNPQRDFDASAGKRPKTQHLRLLTISRRRHSEYRPANEGAVPRAAVGQKTHDRLRDDSPTFPPVFNTPKAAATSVLATRITAASRSPAAEKALDVRLGQEAHGAQGAMGARYALSARFGCVVASLSAALESSPSRRRFSPTH